jgi:L,D-peptidoglycan transpeptidase YkuD (ErfK/YbiS/YcfS/YnhG family)
MLRVSTLAAGRRQGMLELGNLRFPCALGRSGGRVRKREGDGATPIGRWALRKVLYRPDHLRHPRTALAVGIISKLDGWCDAAPDRNYNRRVRHPYAASAERLWRQDELYDVLVVLGYNERPRMRGRGSAVFMHVARPGYAPTEGCIALARAHLLRLIEHVSPQARVGVRDAPRKSARSFRLGR